MRPSLMNVTVVWDWVRERRWWTKALIAAPLGLALLLGCFVLARAMQYRRDAQVAVADFAPEEAHVIVRATNARGHWERLQATEFWKIVRTRMLRDAAVRRELNALMQALEAPTLDDLDDRRWVERNGVSEERILRFAGRDVMAALRMGDTPGASGFCVATQLGFWDYAFAPFASLVLDGVDVNGRKCFRVGGLTVALVGATAIVADDPALLASALKRRGRAGRTRKPVEATITFERSKVLQDARRMLRAFPAGAATVFVDAESLRRIDVGVDIEGADVCVEAKLEGMQTPGGEAPTDAVAYVPASGAGAILLNVGGDRLWAWARRVSEGPAAGDLDRMGQDLMREGLAQLVGKRFDERVVAKLRGPMSLIVGSALGEGQRTYASCAAVLRSEDPAAAEAGFRGILEEFLRGADEKVVEIRSRSVYGHTVWALDYGAGDPNKWSDYLRPCWVAYKDALILANNLDFLAAVLASATTQTDAMVTEEFYRVAEARADRLGLNHMLREGGVASGFLYGAALREGLEGFWPILADKLTDNDQTRQRLRAELEGEWRRQGRKFTAQDVHREFLSALKEKVAQTETSLRGRARVLDYVRWAAFQVTAEEGGLGFKAALELK
ncbi:MAG: hypothetical protein HYY16_16290 [Planctomycetes bacterium]|nr:hypothetical protein [Planctomycetota bacterium]